MCQPVGTCLKLAVTERLLLEQHRNGIGPCRRLRRKQLGHSRLRQCARGVVPAAQNGRALLGRENIQAADRPIRMRNRRRYQPHQPAPERLHAPRIKQVARVFDDPGNPRSRAVRQALLGKAHRQVKLRTRARNRRKPRIQPSNRKTRLHIVLKRQHHLKQRMPRQRARRIENLNQPLKRQIRMAVSRKIARTYPPNQLAQARIARYVRAQHQRVDEKPNQIVQRTVPASGNRAANRNVRPRTKPREQPGKPRLHNHEQARPRLARKQGKPAMQLAGKRKGNAAPAMAHHRRARTVARQLNLIGKPVERLPPERQLPRNRTRAVALLAQDLLLPQRVVGILHRQQGKLRRASLPPRRITAR